MHGVMKGIRVAEGVCVCECVGIGGLRVYAVVCCLVRQVESTRP